ncbi:MAG: pncC [Gammaproteobacteria bacterium]|jgi:nicotinamide-nucleotide amidase|nr:pncC [Gammaproteobacteria bacterium]MCE3239124.1 pncC [Gammaproteobacteria bacterium]
MTTTIEQLASNLGEQLRTRAWKLVTAESCTGGGLAYAITAIPGSSTWFEHGFITYSNLSKIELLGVSELTLNTVGSVSEQTAREMAEGALHHSKAQVSIAITGIAGPDGATSNKPLGTVWIACAAINTPTKITHHLFSGDRKSIREQSIQAALEILTNILIFKGL